MDLYTLKAPPLNIYGVSTTTWQPDVLVEGYDSLIWTERFQPAGDFELKSENVLDTIQKLPLGSFVGLLDSGEVMIVENHSVDENGDTPVLTVTGRTIEAFLENGHTAPAGNSESGGVPNTLLIISEPLNAAQMIEMLSQMSSANYAIQAWDGTLPLVARSTPRNDVYTEVIRLAQEANLGIKNDRHDYGFLGSYFASATYKGLDKRSTVVFDVRAGHFLKGNYLWSIKDYKTAAFAASPTSNYLYKAAGTSAYTQFNYRVGLVDAPDVTTTGTNAQNMLISRAKAYLTEHKKIVKFEGPVSPDVPYTYGPHTAYNSDGTAWTGEHDYYLGDLVKIVGNYGLSQDMLVTEYIRIEDEQGERGYPTLDDPTSV